MMNGLILINITLLFVEVKIFAVVMIRSAASSTRRNGHNWLISQPFTSTYASIADCTFRKDRAPDGRQAGQRTSFLDFQGETCEGEEGGKEGEGVSLCEPPSRLDFMAKCVQGPTLICINRVHDIFAASKWINGLQFGHM